MQTFLAALCLKATPLAVERVNHHVILSVRVYFFLSSFTRCTKKGKRINNKEGDSE